VLTRVLQICLFKRFKQFRFQATFEVSSDLLIFKRPLNYQ
jgi:hypothetical protein